MDAAPTRILIEVEPGTTPITGQVRADGGAPTGFTGWTGLFAVLRAVTGDDRVR
jgi:hypothetical protein